MSQRANSFQPLRVQFYFQWCPKGCAYIIHIQIEYHLVCNKQYSYRNVLSLLHRVNLAVSTPSLLLVTCLIAFPVLRCGITETKKWPVKFTAHRMWPGVKWPQEATYIKWRRNNYFKPQKIVCFGIFWCWKWELDLGNPELKYFIEYSKAIEDYILALDNK